MNSSHVPNWVVRDTSPLHSQATCQNDDIIVSSDYLKTLPIQVKTSRSEKWPSRADQWLDIEIDHQEKQQINRGLKSISNPNLIYICIALGDKHGEDRFFICRKQDIQNACVSSYTKWMEAKDWKRPRNYQSLDNRYYAEDLAPFEDNWALIGKEMGS